MSNFHPKRTEALQKLNEYFSEFDSVRCHEHALQVSAAIVGFSEACELLNVITTEECVQVKSAFDNLGYEDKRPTFLIEAETANS